MTISLSAVGALKEICDEVKEYGEPANPALPKMLRGAYPALKSGGAVTGFYGYGKSLVATLSSLAERASGKKAVVLAAYKLLEAEEGRVDVNELRASADIQADALDCDELRKWALKTLDMAPGRSHLDVSDRIEVKGSGFYRILWIVRRLLESGYSFVVVDEFERIAANPTGYGFGDLRELVDKYFEMVDSWPTSGAGLTVPTTLWVFLDLQTKRRISPTFHLALNVTTQELREFLKRKLSHIPKELEEVEPRNPGVVASLVREVKSYGASRVLESRVEWLRKIAESYPKLLLKTRRALHAAYLAAWYMQNAYAEIPPHKLRAAAEKLGTDDPAEVLTAKKRRKPLLSKTTSGYVLTADAVGHLRRALTESEKQYELGLAEVAHTLRMELEIP